MYAAKRAGRVASWIVGELGAIYNNQSLDQISVRIGESTRQVLATRDSKWTVNCGSHVPRIGVNVFGLIRDLNSNNLFDDLTG
jgi:hypothetical protein